MVELYDYQKDLLHRVEAALDADAKARVMMQLPTGGGKTEIAGQLLKKRVTDGRKAVWMTHRRELTEQSCDRLTRAGVSAKVGKSWDTNDPDAPAMPEGVTILTDRTLTNRTANSYVWSKYGQDDLIVVDEAHHTPATGWERSIKQWPGQMLGMTATPWRMSKEEGFGHLFDTLICGPQVADLQSVGHLCIARVIAPPHEQRILGGNPDRYGEFTPDGIELANSDRPDVMTAGALKFWKEQAGDREKTIVYAVSVNHARNLRAVFDEEGIRAGLVLGSTQQKQAERNRAIEEFKNGSLEVLINVAVVTEGFDVPEASCIVITRPTLSLALFMQMVGRGLRSKDGGGDCLILDLADNTKEHGFPETRREWNLELRGNQPSGEAPVVWCPKCYAESYAASHYCSHCKFSLGQECPRCKWHPWRRWQREQMCGSAHDSVCDLCHADAHVRAHLPVSLDLIVPKENLLPKERPPKRITDDGGYWHLLSSETVSVGHRPWMLLAPDKERVSVARGKITVWPTTSDLRRPGQQTRIDYVAHQRYRPTGPWKSLLFEVAEWLIRNERLPEELLPVSLGRKRYVVHTEPTHRDGSPFEDWEILSNGPCLYLPSSSKEICRAVEKLNRMSPPHEQFYVQFEPVIHYDVFEDRLERCDHHPELCNHPR